MDYSGRLDVIVDPGHGSLALARIVAAELGATAALTRTHEAHVSSAERAQLARKIGAPVFVSLRSGGRNYGGGLGAVVHPYANESSKRLARAIGHIRVEDLELLSPAHHDHSIAACCIEVGDVPREALPRLGAAIAGAIRRYGKEVSRSVVMNPGENHWDVDLVTPSSGGHSAGAIRLFSELRDYRGWTHISRNVDIVHSQFDITINLTVSADVDGVISDTGNDQCCYIKDAVIIGAITQNLNHNLIELSVGWVAHDLRDGWIRASWDDTNDCAKLRIPIELRLPSKSFVDRSFMTVFGKSSITPTFP